MRRGPQNQQPSRRQPRLLLPAICLVAIISAFGVGERAARADMVSLWGQLHGGYLGGTADRFEDGSQGFFGFAAGASITMFDVFMDVRMDKFDTANAGMWNQVGVGVSFGLPIPAIEPWFGLRAAYLYAQFNEGARAAYEEKLAVGEREDDPAQKGLNFSAQFGLDISLVGPLYLTAMGDIGYHVLLPNVTEAHGLNFAGLGGLKLKVGI